MMVMKLAGKKKAVQSALTLMLREEWAARRIMLDEKLMPWAYLRAAMKYGAPTEKAARFAADALNGQRKRRAARWAMTGGRA